MLAVCEVVGIHAAIFLSLVEMNIKTKNCQGKSRIEYTWLELSARASYLGEGRGCRKRLNIIFTSIKQFSKISIFSS